MELSDIIIVLALKGKAVELERASSRVITQCALLRLASPAFLIFAWHTYVQSREGKWKKRFYETVEENGWWMLVYYKTPEREKILNAVKLHRTSQVRSWVERPLPSAHPFPRRTPFPVTPTTSMLTHDSFLSDRNQRRQRACEWDGVRDRDGEQSGVPAQSSKRE